MLIHLLFIHLTQNSRREVRIVMIGGDSQAVIIERSPADSVV